MLDFGFVACQVMHFYGISYREMLALPIHTFWEMSRGVDRIQASCDIRMFRLVQQAIFGEDLEEYLDMLESERGTVAKGRSSSEKECDRKGLEQLRTVLGAGSVQEE